MSGLEHLSDDLLVRSIDDELSGSETLTVESHLAHCAECTRRHHELRSVSGWIESAIDAVRPGYSDAQRESIAQALEAREGEAASPGPRKVLRGFGWSMAIAAALAVALLFGPQWRHSSRAGLTSEGDAQTNAALEVDGETFIPLPYSNPDLPVAASHVVEMQVPVSSLADAGIVFEPISSEVSAPDRSVLADVLIGIDGQPLGVHVLNVE